MDRRAMLTIIVGALMAVLLVAITTAGEVPLAERGPSIDWEPAPLEPPEPEEELAFAPEEELDEEAREDNELPQWVRTALRVIFYAAIAVVTVLVAAYGWRRRPKLVWRETRSDDFDVLDDIAASVAADAAEQRAALQSGTARNAIVECWLRLERLIVDNGVERDPADTSTELATRVLGRFDIDPGAIQELSALYREARFSTHDLPETTRDRAIAALDAVHDGLRRRAQRAADEAIVENDVDATESAS